MRGREAPASGLAAMARGEPISVMVAEPAPPRPAPVAPPNEAPLPIDAPAPAAAPNEAPLSVDAPALAERPPPAAPAALIEVLTPPAAAFRLAINFAISAPVTGPRKYDNAHRL